MNSWEVLGREYLIYVIPDSWDWSIVPESYSNTPNIRLYPPGLGGFVQVRNLRDVLDVIESWRHPDDGFREL